MIQFGFQAGAAINPSRICVPGASAGLVIQAANGTTAPVGVAQEWSNYPPIPGALTVAADATGNCSPQIKLYGEGEVCDVEAGAAVTAWDIVCSDGSGRAITTAATKFSVGIALTAAGGAGEMIKVLLRIGTLPKA